MFRRGLAIGDHRKKNLGHVRLSENALAKISPKKMSMIPTCFHLTKTLEISEASRYKS